MSANVRIGLLPEVAVVSDSKHSSLLSPVMRDAMVI
jgi:hypothetical protein